MIKKIMKMLGKGDVDLSQLVKDGAIILDVRTNGEFLSGNIKDSINIPLNDLENKLSKLQDKNKTIICCCASGMRSGVAKGILKSKGYNNVHNGGGWMSLNKKISK